MGPTFRVGPTNTECTDKNKNTKSDLYIAMVSVRCRGTVMGIDTVKCMQ